MKSFLSKTLLAVTLLSAVPSSLASFDRDVVSGLRSKQFHMNNKDSLNDELLGKAIPVAEYESKHGIKLQRSLNEGDGGEEEAGDDYYMNYNNMVSFSGYSLKFAKCQPVQYFSEYALAAGEHSPMVTDDIVILRLCPSSSCSSDKTYGCQYNFAEYAIELKDYVRIMLRYSAQKRDYMCNWCGNCLQGNGYYDGDGNGQRRRLNEGEGGENNGQQNQDQGNENNGQEEEKEQNNDGQNNEGQEDQADEGDNEQGNQGNDDQQAEAEQNNGDDGYNGNDGYAEGDDYYTYACNGWSTYCTEYTSLCLEDENAQYLNFEGYMDYLDCAEVDYNNYAYFVRPRCDGYQGTIKMGIYYDNYCVQYAGNEVSLKNVGVGFRESAFQAFYSGECIDCSESENLPYDSNSALCNRVHYDSAKCTNDMVYDLFGGAESDSTECSYIESLRFGTYNELGQLSSKTTSGSASEEATTTQKTLLGASIAFCVILVIYACYLHHAMTNLLIKSLSHRELLPPSRHESRRNSPRRSGRRLKKVAGEPDWDEPNEGEYA